MNRAAKLRADIAGQLATQPGLLTTNEVAEAFGVHITTVRRWDESGWLRPVCRTPFGNHRRYDAATVLARAATYRPSEPPPASAGRGEGQDRALPAASRGS